MTSLLESSTSLVLQDVLKKSDSTYSDLLTMSVSVTLSSSSSLWSISDTPAFSTVCENPYKGPTFLTVTFDELRHPALSAEKGVTVSIPTAPRLKNVMVERRFVSRWTEKIPTDLFEHVPWADIEEVPQTGWTPEGSIVPRRLFIKTLQDFHTHHRLRPCTESVEPSSPINSIPESISPWSRNHRRTLSASRREAQVVGREISVPGRESLSLDVPPAMMSAQMVDLMCEIHQAHQEEPVTPPRDQHKLRPPMLMVSTSTAIIPISLSSSSQNLSARGSPPSIPIPALPPLAIRRGKKQLAPLNIAKAADPATASMDEYPGVPTAFLGSSPTAFTPSAEGSEFFASTVDDTLDMQLDDMLANLRARAAALPPGRHPRTGTGTGSASDRKPQPADPPSPSSSSTGSSSDGWTTVDSLLESYHRDSPDSPTSTETTPDSCRVRPSMMLSPTTSSAASSPDSDDIYQGLSTDSNDSFSSPSSPPRTTDPSRLSTSPERNSMSGSLRLRSSRLSDPPKRGILKTTKVVRFMDPPVSPQERSELVMQGDNPDSSTPTSAGLSPVQPSSEGSNFGSLPRNPSPLRQITSVLPPAQREPRASSISEVNSLPSLTRARQVVPVRRSVGANLNRSTPPVVPAQMNRRHTVSPQSQLMNAQRYAIAPRAKEHAAFRTSVAFAKEGDENAARRSGGAVGKTSGEVEKKSTKIRPFKSLLGKLKG